MGHDSDRAVKPFSELRAFFRAALVDPVPRDHTEPDGAFRRRRIVVAVTLVVGALVLAWALRIEPGNDVFYLATFSLAAVSCAGVGESGIATKISRRVMLCGVVNSERCAS